MKRRDPRKSYRLEASRLKSTVPSGRFSGKADPRGGRSEPDKASSTGPVGAVSGGGWLAPLGTRAISDIRRLLHRQKARGYAVGGLVRDLQLGATSKNLDLVVSGISPEEVCRYLHDHLGFSRPTLFPRFQTALVVKQGLEIEVCSLQGSLESDASKRDFTMNCLYVDLRAAAPDLRSARILDPTGRGRADLRRGILSTPADPCLTFWLDPLRILRALRFYACRGFRVDAVIADSIPRVAYLLGRVAPERIRVELEQILVSRRVVSSLKLMQRLGVNAVILPELSRTHGFSQATPYHAYDLFTHTIKTVGKVPRELNLRLAALLHDLGKVDTKVDREGRAVYYGHQEVSAQMGAAILERFRFPKRVRRQVVFLVGNHMINYSRAWSDAAVRRLVRKMGPSLNEVLSLAEADRRAQGLGREAETTARLRRRIETLARGRQLNLRLPVTGHDIMAVLELAEGPMVGRAKEFLWGVVAERRKPLSRREALEMLREWAKSQNPA